MKKSIILAATLALGITSASYASTNFQQSAQETTGVLEKHSSHEQLDMLERGIVPTTPEETISLWAKAVQNRNGALQYALFTPATKLAYKKTMEQFHWVTGASSPWVQAYKIVSQKENSDKTLNVVVEFELATSTGYAGKDVAKLTLVQLEKQWFINELQPYNEQAIGIWRTAEFINELNIENNLSSIKQFKSQLGYTIEMMEADMDKLTISDATCDNEEGNPPCTHYYYKDSKAKKDRFILSVIQLTEQQKKSDYFQSHPFLTEIGTNGKETYYAIHASELPYAKSMDSVQGKEWSRLRDVLNERLEDMIFTNK